MIFHKKEECNTEARFTYTKVNWHALRSDSIVSIVTNSRIIRNLSDYVILFFNTKAKPLTKNMIY